MSAAAVEPARARLRVVDDPSGNGHGTACRTWHRIRSGRAALGRCASQTAGRAPRQGRRDPRPGRRVCPRRARRLPGLVKWRVPHQHKIELMSDSLSPRLAQLRFLERVQEQDLTRTRRWIADEERRETERARGTAAQGVSRCWRQCPGAVSGPPPQAMEASPQHNPLQDPLPRRAGHGQHQRLASLAEDPLQHQPHQRLRESRPRPSPRIKLRLETLRDLAAQVAGERIDAPVPRAAAIIRTPGVVEPASSVIIFSKSSLAPPSPPPRTVWTAKLMGGTPAPTACGSGSVSR